MEICIRLIYLKERELGIVAHIKTLVAENSAHLVDSLKSADYKALEIEFKGNAQVEILVEGVVMGHKRTRGSAARILNKNGRLDLDEILGIEIVSYLADYQASLYKCILDIGVDYEVKVAAAIAGVRIAQTVKLFGQRKQRLRQQAKRGCVDGYLAPAGLEHRAAHFKDIADIPLLELCKCILADIVYAHIDLNTARAVTDIDEVRLAHIAS